MNEESVRIEALNCGNCGAPLKVPETAQFVTCNHCRTSLVVKRMHSITLTEKMEQTQQRLAEAEAQLAALVYRNHVMEETRRWERERELYMIKDKHGNKTVPSEGTGWLAFLVSIGIGLFAMTSGIGLFGLLVPIVGFSMLVYHQSKAREYQAAYQRHLRRLRAIPKPDASDSESSPANYLKQLESAPTVDGLLMHSEVRWPEE
jgi:LSD1 subclass zinc finger protein